MRAAREQKNIDRLIELATQRQARTSRAVRQQVLPEWLAERDEGVADDALYERAVLRLLSKVVQLRRSFSARKGAMRGMVLVKHLVLLILEKVCDIGLCAAFLWLRLYLYSGILAGILVFSSIAQALSAYLYTREGSRAAIMALFGLKVGIESWRAIYDTPPGRHAPSTSTPPAAVARCPAAYA